LPRSNAKKEKTTMKKLITTATALMFALGLTVAAQAQTAAEKPKPTPAPVQKVTTGTPETAKDVVKTEAPKVAPTEAKKVEPIATGKKPEAEKGKEAAGSTAKGTGKEVKTTPAQGKKHGLETPKTDK
jgi:hypothetical protein